MESDEVDSKRIPGNFLPIVETPRTARTRVGGSTPPPVLETSVARNALDEINQSEEEFTNMLAFPSIDEVSEERVRELRRGKGRRRASSFDVSLPVPKIKLRPRFNRQLWTNINHPNSSHAAVVHPPSHFRSHTYDAGFSNVFAEALAADSAQASSNSELFFPTLQSPLDLSSLRIGLPQNHQKEQEVTKPIARKHKRNIYLSPTRYSSSSSNGSMTHTPNTEHSNSISAMNVSEKSAFKAPVSKMIQKHEDDSSVESSLAGFPYLDVNGNMEEGVKEETKLEQTVSSVFRCMQMQSIINLLPTYYSTFFLTNTSNFLKQQSDIISVDLKECDSGGRTNDGETTILSNETRGRKSFCNIIGEFSPEALEDSSASSLVLPAPPRSPSRASKLNGTPTSQQLRTP